MKGRWREGAGRPPGQAITEDAREEILRRYLAGEPVAKIAERFGVSPSYPTILARRRGVQRKMKAEPSPALEAAPEPNIPLETPEEKIARLASRGIGASVIAAMLRVPYKDVLAVLANR